MHTNAMYDPTDIKRHRAGLIMASLLAMAQSPFSHTPAKRPTAGGYKHPTRRYHEETKKRRQMAARSNRINRRNCHSWKH